MPSERTFFNKAIYKRALSRFWLIGAAYAVVLCFLTLMCGQYFNSEFTEMSEYVSYSILSNMTRREILAAAAAAVVMAVAVYGWMFRKTSAAYISALPVTREALLISSMLAALTLLILPCIIAMLVSLLLYGGAEAARFLRLLAPMVPFLYTDIVTDGCLKGLGQMMASMAFNIAEAALGLVLVWALLPRWAITGYLVTLYICEVFNFTLSLLRLRQIINGDGSH